jgi:hypothetical protein
MALELRGGAPALLDEPVALSLRGGEALRWRARLTDDAGHVWRTEAGTAAALGTSWDGVGKRAALDSLRPVRLEVRAETGRAGASRVLERRLLADGVLVRRWPGGRLLRPAGEPLATVVLDGPLTAAALLASRGALVAVGDPAILEAVPGAGAPARVAPPLPPGVPARKPDDPAAWDALLAELGLAPREQA